MTPTQPDRRESPWPEPSTLARELAMRAKRYGTSDPRLPFHFGLELINGGHVEAKGATVGEATNALAREIDRWAANFGSAL